jgi:hypothetical protein
MAEGCILKPKFAISLAVNGTLPSVYACRVPTPASALELRTTEKSALHLWGGIDDDYS